MAASLHRDGTRRKQKKVNEKKQQLEEAQNKLFSLEEKWIKSEISRDIYDRWYSIYNQSIISLKGSIERLTKDQGEVFYILNKHLSLLTDMRYVYSKADTMHKREFVGTVFDNNLYYQDSIYRTPTMMDIFTHNSLLMKEKGYLIYEEKRDNLAIIPSSGLQGSTIEHLIPILVLLDSMKIS